MREGRTPTNRQNYSDYNLGLFATHAVDMGENRACKVANHVV